MNPQMLDDYKAASAIRDKLVVAKVNLSQFDGVVQTLEYCKGHRQTIAKAEQRNWQYAAHLSTLDLICALEMLSSRTRALLNELQPYLTPRLEVTERDLFSDIQSLRSEFEDVTVDLQAKQITVRTDFITLNDFDFGSFDIELDWSAIDQSFEYRVVAVDPVPATANSEIVHPHVQHQTLCEGEGATAITRALFDGRINDFFCIVDRILKSYNPGSAYVKIEDWHGVECCDCGSTVDADSAGCCERCQTDLCGSCARSCCVCSETRCDHCLSSCSGCDDNCCGGCLEPCTECHSNFCPSCINEGKCDDCYDNETAIEPKPGCELASQEKSAVVQPTADVHALCLEQTAIPA